MSVNGLVTSAPAGGRLSSAGVLFFALAAATPLTVVALGVPAAYAGGLLVVPLVFGVVGLVLVIFSGGYVAMARRTPNAGALYAMVARGLGRPLGIGAGWIALLSYNALQLGLYALVGRFTIGIPWWQAVAGAWIVVTLLGLARAAIVGWLLAVVVLAEIVVIAGFSVADILDPAGRGITAPAWSLPHLDRPALGLLLVGATLAFVGFETTAAYAEDARRPARSTCLAVVVLAVLFAGAAWALPVAAGPAVAGLSGARGPELIFDLAAVRLAPWAVTLGRVVLLTGLVAGLLALHFTSSRYLFALGRDRVLPRGLGRPAAASLTQSICVGVVLAVCWYFGVTPASQWAHWLTVGGGIGVLVLLVGASLAALLFLNRAPNGENAWQRFLAPGLSTVAFGALGYLAFTNLAALLGVGGRSVWIVPGALVAAVLLGILVGLVMRLARPVAYAGIGLGGTAVVISPTSPPVPDQRMPGAHRPERINGKLSA